MRPFLLCGMFALLLAGGLLVLRVPTAQAKNITASRPLVPCAGEQCNGTDPYTTGCAGSAASYGVVDSVPVLWQGVNFGWVQLWFSRTCGTNWARYVCTRRCRPVSLVLMTCAQDLSQTSVQGPLAFAATGRTKQQYLPRTPASASLLFEVNGPEFGSAATGCW